MNTGTKILLTILVFCTQSPSLFAQRDQNVLINRMRQHENYILRSYLEYQKLYYEDKARIHELKAFEDLLTVYIDQVMEIYETLNLSNEDIQVPRNIAARALIFKALMYLEKAPLNHEYYEYACYSYYKALNLYSGSDDPPVLFKDLPQQIQSGDKFYYRLIDILDDKGQGLHAFGKVIISFRNFRVTANFDPQQIELIKIEDDPATRGIYTYNLAESRIIKSFEEVFRKGREVEQYVALPHGTYILRLNHGSKSDYTALTRFYVRANQEQKHIMEPLADWLILYENPTSKRPDFYKFRRTVKISDNNLAASNGFEANGSDDNDENKNALPAPPQSLSKKEMLVAEIVSEYLGKYEVKLMFDLNDPEIKGKAIEIIAKSIVEYVESEAFYNEWNVWTVSWDIAKKVREIISPGSLIPIELLELIYGVIKEL
ncbi:MAG: hypothetical protein ACE5HS_16105 [bacterium]